MLCSAERGRPAAVAKMPMPAANGEGLTAMAGIAQEIQKQRLASASAQELENSELAENRRSLSKRRKRKWGREV